MRRALRWFSFGVRGLAIGSGVLIGGPILVVMIATALSGFAPDKGSVTATKSTRVQRCLRLWNAGVNQRAQHLLARRRAHVEVVSLAYDRNLELCTLDVETEKNSWLYELANDGTWSDAAEEGGFSLPSAGAQPPSNVRLTRLGLLEHLRRARAPKGS